MAIHTPRERAAHSTMPEPDDHLPRLLKALGAVARIVFMTTSRQPMARDGAITERPSRADRMMARFHPYSSPVRLLLWLLLVFVLLPPSIASADLSAPFATVTGVCDPTTNGRSDFDGGHGKLPIGGD